MKKIQIVARDDFESKNIKKYFEEVLLKQKFILSEEPEMVIAIGGDGTMLQAFHRFGPDVSYVGLHTGTLGFYADWRKEEADQLLEHILTNQTPDIVEYPLAEIELELTDGRKEKRLALNEVVVKAKSLSTFILEVYINNERFETFRGDGMIISTPSGSTAYNYSVLGSVVHPSVEALQIAELAAINNGEFRTLNRSFVLPNHHQLDLYIKNKDQDVLVGVDGFEQKFEGIRKINSKVAKEKVKFVRYRHFPFWQRVREKFLNN